MPDRDIASELKVLTQQVGLSRSEALQVLGISDEADPLISSAMPIEEDTAAPTEPEPVLAQMFPEVPKRTIESALADNGNDIDKATEYLLSWRALREEQANADYGTKVQKEARKNRKAQRKLQKSIETEENHISVIEASLKIPREEARALYWTNNNDITKAIMSRAPYQPVTVGKPQKLHDSANDNDTWDDKLEYYGSLSRRELLQQREDTLRRIKALQERYSSRSTSQSDRIRALDVLSELYKHRQNLRCMEVTLNKAEKLHSSGLLSGSDRIDLHGCTLEEAKPIVSDAIKLFKNSSRTHLEIITGAGRHSVGGRAVLKTWIRKYLREVGVRTKELDGSFVISQGAWI